MLKSLWAHTFEIKELHKLLLPFILGMFPTM
jgi:hypothetical protein